MVKVILLVDNEWVTPAVVDLAEIVARNWP